MDLHCCAFLGEKKKKNKKKTISDLFQHAVCTHGTVGLLHAREIRAPIKFIFLPLSNSSKSETDCPSTFWCLFYLGFNYFPFSPSSLFCFYHCYFLSTG